MRARAEARADDIVDVVIELLETEGYDAVQVRTVARKARTSLATMYKLFGTRDELIVTALEKWLDAHAYSELSVPEPGDSSDSPYETMVRVLRTVFEPWERHPRMLEAYHRARSGPGGERLDRHGLAAVRPIIRAALPDVDPALLDEIGLVHSYVVRGAIARFADGEISVDAIRPLLERALYLLAANLRDDGGEAATPATAASGG
ncbi:MAG TPA: TetR family transcriptional regulator [Acidimicrobiales bacterium]